MPWHGFLQRMREFEEVSSRTFFTSLFSDFFNRRFGNTWQLAFNRVHEASKKDYLQLQDGEPKCHLN
jgi:hypothetical protein